MDLLLTVQDRLSKGLNPPIKRTRDLTKEIGRLMAAMDQLQKRMGRSGAQRGFREDARAIHQVVTEANKAAAAVEKLKTVEERTVRSSRRSPAIHPDGGGQRSNQGLGRSMVGDLVALGAGYKVLQFYRGGVQASGDFEEAMRQLRNAFGEFNVETGRLDEGKLAVQMDLARKQTIQLGNDLQGTTQDYVEMYAALRQGGIQTEQILNGAGKAAAYLANVTGAITTGQGAIQAQQLAQFFQMYRLQSDADFDRTVNLFSGLQDRFNINSEAIIEGSKYFQGMANTLGMKGIGGAEDTAKLFAFLKRYGGLEGSIAGTTMTSLFNRFVTRGDKEVQELKKTKGIDLQLFDSKGQFRGMENAFKEFEKLRKLNPEEMIEAIHKLAGEEGAKAVTAMVAQGADGWRQVTTEASKAIPVNQKITEQMRTYNAKVEAVEGSWTNLKATMFESTAEWLKPQLDKTNQFMGRLQELAKSHPTLTRTALLITAIGTAVIVTSKAINGLRTASLILDNLKGSANGAAGGLQRVSGVRMVGVTAGLVGIAIALYKINEAIDKLKEVADSQQANSDTRYGRLQDKEKAATQSGQSVDRKDYSFAASVVLAQLNADNSLKEALTVEGSFGLRNFGSRRAMSFIPGYNPFAPWPEGGFHPSVAAQHISQTGKELANPNVMAAAIKQVQQSYPDPGQRQNLMEAFRIAFPESFKAATQQLADEQLKAANETQKTTTALTAMQQPLLTMPANLNSANSGLLEFSNRLRTVQLTPPAAVAPGAPAGPVVPKSAIGSVVQRDGLVHAHRGNVITPARLSRRSPGDWIEALRDNRRSGGGSNVTININVAPGARAADDPAALAQLAADAVDRVMSGDYLARRIAQSARRDAERN